MAKILVAGLDGAKANFGIVKMIYDTETQAISPVNMKLVQTEKSKNKQIRASSDNLARATTIADALRSELKDCTICFAEIPSGGQSAQAVLAFGIVIGLYASISLDVPLVEVTPSETKIAAVGTRTASKEEMIEWAIEKYPNAGWLTTKRKGVEVPVAKNEHLADATAIIHAGINTPAFKQVCAILGANQV